MKTIKYISGVAFAIIIGNKIFAQDPLQKLFIKRDYLKIQSTLTTSGKLEYEKEKQAYGKLLNPRFKISANTIMNRTLQQLAGTLKPVGDNSILLQRQLEKNLKSISIAKENMAKLRIPWNPLWLDDITKYTKDLIPMACPMDFSSLTPVKDQRGCGSCWAFAAAATWEHAHKKIFGPYGYIMNHDLSEEDIMNCGKNCSGTDVGSCKGGWSQDAFDYITCTKIANETSYPYTGNDANTCKTKTRDYGAYGWLQVGSNTSFPTVQDIKAAIMTYGAVVSYVNVGTGWSSYDTGVLHAIASGSNDNLCYNATTKSYGSCPDGINHAITIVGWCDLLNAWIIKNSWGTDWGSYGGYAYVDFNSYNIGRYVYFVFPMFHN